MAAGALFPLSEHARGDQNREHLVTRALHLLNSDAFDRLRNLPRSRSTIANSSPSTAGEPAPRVLRRNLWFRDRRRQWSSKSGEEIYTDEYGRVKLQFHWDRYGGSDQDSSCWVRWRRSGRARTGAPCTFPDGQEVIVDFLEGDRIA